jgi:L-arabinonolactonase
MQADVFIEWQDCGDWQYLPLYQQLGESVCYDDQQQRLWWTDIRRQQLFCLHWTTQQLWKFATPQPVTAVALTQDPDELVVACATGFALYQPFAGHWYPLASAPLSAGQRLNDGRLDRQGRLLAGAMHDDGSGKAEAVLFRLQAGHCQPLLQGLQISNGLCFSPDGRWLYHADSPRRQIRRYPYAPDGQALGCGELFCQIAAPGYPDGACIDRLGRLWTALWGAGAVQAYTPDGQLLQQFRLPVSQPTCPVFAGPCGDWLVVSSAYDGLCSAQRAAEPQAGALWRRRLEPLALPAERWSAAISPEPLAAAQCEPAGFMAGR